jgi:alkanesulfonate monooxygenase SsuD/methylene tetrahydromethanopterin reductase-like flavin-dependent oxidoreductase (luciferase family)
VPQSAEPRAPAPRGLTGLRRGLAVPCFTPDPADIIGLGLAAEQGGFDGFFLWDHLVHDDTGAGPPVLDPWPLLAVLASQTSRIRLGTLITPVPRRRPWQLAKETVTVDRLSNGRLILGVGIGSPRYADFGIFHEPTSGRARAERLDEGLEVLTGLWTGGRFAFSGQHFTVEPVRFRPVPVQHPRIPIWVGGVLPATGPVRRACRWDGMVPLARRAGGTGRPSPGDIAAVRDQAKLARGSAAGFDLVVWADLEQEPGEVAGLAPDYVAAGATWWVESTRSDPGWLGQATERVARGC